MTPAMSRILMACALSVAALIVDPRAAGATMTEIFGGPGGGHFSLTCDPGHYLVGVHARAGAWVDGVGLVCAPRDGAGKIGSGRRKGYTGGRGGSEQEVYCSPGEAVTGLSLVHTRGNGLKRQYLNTIGILCQHRAQAERCISSGDGCGPLLVRNPTDIAGAGGVRPFDVLTCPRHELATGIQGRSGIYVDAIGLICATPAAAQPEPSENKKIRVLGKKKIEADPTRCAQGFVWRAARPDDLVCVTPEARARTAEENKRAASRRDPNGAYGPNSCVVGYVWREAFEDDSVCVTPETRTLVREENRLAASRRAGG